MEITEIKGVGEKKKALFNRLGIYDTGDLLRYYPRDYEVYEKPLFIAQINSDLIGRVISVDCVVSGKPVLYRAGKFNVTTITVRDENGDAVKCKWFNMPYIGTKLKKGLRFVFRGLLSSKKGDFFLEQPRMITPSEYEELEKHLLPVYPLTKGLSQNIMRSVIAQALECEDVFETEYLSRDILAKAGVGERGWAISNIHVPDSFDEARIALERLKFDEFFLFSLSVISRKKANEGIKTRYIINSCKRMESLIAALPFDLTGAQMNAWKQISADLASDTPMNRLLQGDVGSGKTIIALLALLDTFFCGFQAALMAPTEVLANQEYKELCALTEKLGIEVNVQLLTGSLKASEKREVYKKLQSGEADIVIGTHALFQAGADYNRLGLVIIDEQHRFGVGQRRALEDKSVSDIPNVLVMSATPIPRTLAWILYGDLDISVIDELPAGRKPVKNAVVDVSYRPKAYEFIRKKISEGRQIYVICPMVEESEGLEGENVTDYSVALRSELGTGISVEALHGRMKADIKQEIMDRFSSGETDVLVSTTVIEVGVNVPNATVMMIENAERFGLSQLHQLRGRVGRGSEESYCIFVAAGDSDDTKKRLDIMAETNDGFVIAQKDLEMRGPGEFFGLRQSGDPGFILADPAKDTLLLEKSVKLAGEVITMDPDLQKPENFRLRREVEAYRDRMGDRVSL